MRIPLLFLLLGVTTVACSSNRKSTRQVAAQLRSVVEPSRYEADLRFIAQERAPGSPHWKEVQDLCASRLESYGYEVERHAYKSGVNVVGTKQGAGADVEQVLVSAHYDHIPGCAGADDNATGVAAVLEAARVLALGTYERTLKVVCFDEEERGLIGSKAYVDRASGRDRILVDINFEMIGYRDSNPNTQSIPDGIEQLFPEAYAQVRDNDFKGDFIALAGDEKASQTHAAFIHHATEIGLPTLLLQVKEENKQLVSLSALGRSDHRSFWLSNHPALMLTDSAEFRNPGYHCRQGPDSIERLDLDFATSVVRAAVAAAAEALVPVP